MTNFKIGEKILTSGCGINVYTILNAQVVIRPSSGKLDQKLTVSIFNEAMNVAFPVTEIWGSTLAQLDKPR